MATEQHHMSSDKLHATKTSVYTQVTIQLSVVTSDVFKLFSCHLHGTDGAGIAWFFHAGWKVLDLFRSFCYSYSYFLFCLRVLIILKGMVFSHFPCYMSNIYLRKTTYTWQYECSNSFSNQMYVRIVVRAWNDYVEIEGKS